MLKKFVNTFANPRKDMTFANRGNTYFALEQDRALLCAVDKFGYGNWDSVREELIKDDALLLQHTVQGMNTDAIAKRCDYRMRQMERELEAREKKVKSLRPVNVIAAENTIRAIKEMEIWDAEASRIQLNGGDVPSLEILSSEAREYTKERAEDCKQVIDRLREIEIQIRGCKELAEQTRQSIMRGDQYVNYSHITLKAGGGHITADGTMTDVNGYDMEAFVNKKVLAVKECGECNPCCDRKTRKLCLKRQEMRKKMIVEYNLLLKDCVSKAKNNIIKSSIAVGNSKKDKHTWPRNKRIREDSVTEKPGKTGNSATFKKKISPPGNPLGNKRMSVPDELLPDFCKRIGASGTRKRMDTINEFVKDHPSVSIRQVTFKFAEITTKSLPECIPKPEKPKGKGRAFTFFLRPRFYHLLLPEQRPDDWEKYATQDELLWKEECQKAKEEKEKKDQKMKDMMGGPDESVENNSIDGRSITPVPPIDDDETEDDEPVKKKGKA